MSKACTDVVTMLHKEKLKKNKIDLNKLHNLIKAIKNKKELATRQSNH